MTFNSVIELILRYFTESDRSGGQLRHESWRLLWGSVQIGNILLQVHFGHNWPTQQSHGLFATAELIVYITM